MSPLKFEPRVTSHFSRRRVHPVHNTVRAHTGVDYGAPHGAAVVAVADGTVVSAGWAGGGGKQVRIRHTGGIETFYMHLSSYGSGIRAGAQRRARARWSAASAPREPRPDRISTSRLRKNDRFVDPVAERRRQPPGEPIPAAHLDAYRAARDGMLEQI